MENRLNLTFSEAGEYYRGVIGATKFLLESGDPAEYREVTHLARENGIELWGGITNPSLFARLLKGQKLPYNRALTYQKEIISEILNIVPGAVSIDIYADLSTKADQMVEQALEINAWHERLVVNLPTTVEGLKARTVLRRRRITVNNTIVFMPQQVFALYLHEYLCQKTYGPIRDTWPSFVSLFVGNIDEHGENGRIVLENSLAIKDKFEPSGKPLLWMHQASIRHVEHLKLGIINGVDLITAPTKVYKDWFALSPRQRVKVDINSYQNGLRDLLHWYPTPRLTAISSLEKFFIAIQKNSIPVNNSRVLTNLKSFTNEWDILLSK